MFRAPETLEPPRPNWVDPPPARRRRFRWRPLLVVGVWLLVWGGLALGGVVLWCARDLPRPEAALQSARRPTLVLADRENLAFATIGDVVGEPLHLTDLPPSLPAALVAIEDRRFWRHGGLDWVGILRAAVVNLWAGRVVQGGSTLTQQVAKNLFLSNARTLRRKVQEVLLTLWLERSFSKTQILEIYLNRVFLGRHAWGLDAAAHTYFGVSARALTLGQAALLAGLPKAPSRLNPIADPEAARARAKTVLAAMVANGSATGPQADAALAGLAFRPGHAGLTGGGATTAGFADWAAEQAERLLPDGTDARLRTTLDRHLQAAATARLALALERPGFAEGQGAVVAMDARTGAVLAMVGGRPSRGGAYNRATEARRQPGSAFKPFVWLAAIEAAGLTPDSPVLDAPIDLDGWQPRNFDGRYRGSVSLEDALAESLNTVSVRLQQLAGGPEKVAAVARRLGLAGDLGTSPTLALGTGNVGVLELAAAYAPLFNGGRRVEPTGVLALDTPAGPVAVPAPAPVEVVTPARADMVVRMMVAVVTRGSGRAAALAGRVVAGKTGTTQDGRDAWFVGAALPPGGDPVVVAVWVGRDDDRPIAGLTGGGLPAQIFHDVAAELTADPQQPRPVQP